MLSGAYKLRFKLFFLTKGRARTWPGAGRNLKADFAFAILLFDLMHLDKKLFYFIFCISSKAKFPLFKIFHCLCYYSCSNFSPFSPLHPAHPSYFPLNISYESYDSCWCLFRILDVLSHPGVQPLFEKHSFYGKMCTEF